MALIDDLEWRYATKKYNAEKKVAREYVNKIVEAARLAPTSLGLQQFRVIVIEDQKLKEQIVPIAMNQQSIAEASHLLVFAAWDRYTAERIDNALEHTANERHLPKDHFDGLAARLKNQYLPQTAEQNFVHTARQAYIGLGLAIAQAAELKIDSTPMEGFNNDALDELLDLRTIGFKSVLLLPIGYRDTENDWLVNLKKVRTFRDDFVLHPQDASINKKYPIYQQ